MAQSGYLFYDEVSEKYYNVVDDETTTQDLKTNGGGTYIIIIKCSRCFLELFVYQKDGNGPVTSCYIDRILTTFYGLTLDDFINCPKCFKRLTEPLSTSKTPRQTYKLLF